MLTCRHTKAFALLHPVLQPPPHLFLSSSCCFRYHEVQGCSTAMSLFICSLDRSGDWLSLKEAVMISEFGLRFLRQYSVLARRSVDRKECMWKVRPKFHYYHHMLFEIRGRRFNVCRTQTFAGEDFMGKMKSLGRKCHRSSITKRALQRYIQLVGYRWKSVHHDC